MVKNKVTFIRIDDLNFLFNYERVKMVSEYLKDKGIAWACQTRPETISREICDLLVKNNCQSVEFGIESFDKELRRYYGKTGSIEMIQEKMGIVNSYQIHSNANLIIGPKNNINYLEIELHYLKKLEFNSITINILSIYPGNRLWSSLCLTKRVTHHYTERKLQLSEVYPEYRDKELNFATRYLYKKFYYRPLFQIKLLLKEIKKKYPYKEKTFFDTLFNRFKLVIKSCLYNLLFLSVFDSIKLNRIKPKNISL